jgi:hypothetical protein
MKKHIVGSLLILALVRFASAQQADDLFDAKKSQEELEIMKGILSTKLSLSAEDSRREASSLWRFSNLNAFYLSGQGAVFIIPTSGLNSLDPIFSFAALGSLREHYETLRLQNQEIARQNEQIRRLGQQMALQAMADMQAQKNVQGLTESGGGIGAEVGSGAEADVKPGSVSDRDGAIPAAPASPAMPAPPAPPAIPAPPPPPMPPIPLSGPPVNPEEIQKKAEEARKQVEAIKKNLNDETRKIEAEDRERLRKLREEEKANRQKFLRNLVEIKANLIEALANYGDSLTTVKAEEYINLVLITDNFDGARNARHDILSSKKKWITDYKAGRLSLEDFKQRILQYVEQS